MSATRVRKQKHRCHVLCLARRIAARCAEEPASSSCAGNMGQHSQNGSQKVGRAIPNTTYCWVSVSTEREPGSNSLWPAKTGRRLTNSEVMEYEANREEDEAIQESPNMKYGNIWESWNAKRIVKKTGTSDNVRKTEASGNYGKRSEL